MNKAERSRAAAILGSRGGKARMANLTKEERSELGRAAVRSRWDKVNQQRLLDDARSRMTTKIEGLDIIDRFSEFLKRHGVSSPAVQTVPPEVILSKIPTVYADGNCATMSPNETPVGRVVQIAEGPVKVIVTKIPTVVPRSAADRLAAGLCRGCGAPRVRMSNGKLNAQWCHDCREKQRAYDKASWQKRHGAK